MDAPALRMAFASHLGTDRYREFVRQLNRFCRQAKRLRYWQELAWIDFTRLHPEFKLPFHKLLEAFHVCWLHDCVLERVTQRVLDGQVQYDPDYARAWNNEFPYSYSKLSPTLEGVVPLADIEVDWCPECEKARGTWEQKH